MTDPDPTEPGDVARLLKQRGYWQAAGSSGLRPTWERYGGTPVRSQSDDERLREAILLLQRRYGLPMTGAVDEKVWQILAGPGCGLPDNIGPAEMRADPGKWGSPHLTFQFESFLPGIPEIDQQRAWENACRTWSAVSKLSFEEVSARGDMRVICGAGDHGDDYPFDGARGVLGHAFYPSWNPTYLAGDVHIDASEAWSCAEDCPADRYDLESVFLHEIGHAVGLDHSTNSAAVMFTAYIAPRRRLHSEDIDRIRQLY